jgi:hypothetical protein
MSLACKETDEDCSGQKKAYVVTHPVTGVGVAVSGTTIGSIPARETYVDPCRRYREGLNVHMLDGSQGTFTADGHYQANKPGKFAFAIMRSTAEKYLPKTLAWIDRQAERRSDN